MGRIKSTLVKRTTRQLLTKSTEFNESFENNKKILGNTMPSKKMRNKIAGYLARVVRIQRESATKMAKKAELASKQTPEYEIDVQAQ